jgi:hypothetical protein
LRFQKRLAIYLGAACRGVAALLSRPWVFAHAFRVPKRVFEGSYRSLRIRLTRRFRQDSYSGVETSATRASLCMLADRAPSPSSYHGERDTYLERGRASRFLSSTTYLFALTFLALSRPETVLLLQMNHSTVEALGTPPAAICREPQRPSALLPTASLSTPQ